MDQQGLAGLDDGVQGIGDGVGACAADQHGSLGIEDTGDDLFGLHGGDGLIQTGDHAQVAPGQDLMAGELPGDAVDDLELKLHRLFQADGVQGIGYHRDLLLVFDQMPRIRAGLWMSILSRLSCFRPAALALGMKVSKR